MWQWVEESRNVQAGGSGVSETSLPEQRVLRGGGCVIRGAMAAPYSLDCPTLPVEEGAGEAGSLSRSCLRKEGAMCNWGLPAPND